MLISANITLLCKANLLKLNRGFSLRDRDRLVTLRDALKRDSMLEWSQCVLIGADTESDHGSTNQALSRQMTYSNFVVSLINSYATVIMTVSWVVLCTRRTRLEPTESKGNPVILNTFMNNSNIYLKHSGNIHALFINCISRIVIIGFPYFWDDPISRGVSFVSAVSPSRRSRSC